MQSGCLSKLFGLRNFALATGAILIASSALHCQQPYAYPAAPQYSPPQYSQPAPQYSGQYTGQYSGQQPYEQQQMQPADPQQPQYAAQPGAGSTDIYGSINGTDTQPTATQQPLSADQLLAPVALYPDALLAQLLAASTYPAQIAAADQWLHQMQAQGYNDPNQIVAGADAQTGWDPSVKALTAFPQVLDLLSGNLQWTTSLGNAYYNQPQDVMQTVQVLRDRAQQAGTLESSPQEEVTEDQGNIDLAPATPDTVYVPAYNPWASYGSPIAPYPGFSSSLVSMLGGFGAHYGYGGLQFGMGLAMTAFEHAPWGWLGWGLNWLTNSVLFNHSDYNTHSSTVADWGFPHGGPRAHGPGGPGFGAPGSGAPERHGPGFGHPEPYNRAGGYENGRGPGDSRPGNRMPENSFNHWNRGDERSMPRPVFGSTHPALPPQQAYSRAPFTAPARPSGYGPRPENYAARPPIENRGYGGEMYRPRNAYDYANRPAQSYAERPGMAFSSPYRTPAFQSPAYRTPQYESPRGYASRPSESYGNGYARNEKSGGFHLFGGGHGSNTYKAPKGFFGGGHESRGFGHEKAPRMSHGGGGHFGGGGHSGGGHSGGHRHF